MCACAGARSRGLYSHNFESTPEVNSNAESDAFVLRRLAMVETQLRARGIFDARVLDAMRRVPRQEFVPKSLQAEAYEDHPLPIGAGQTISQPYIVAIMLQALAVQPTDRVLEVGTGSGYVTALLAELAAEVISIERHAGLAEQAEKLSPRLGYTNVKCLVGDGSRGFAESAPYDAIMVSAAAAEIPSALLAQLSEGGRMIVPVGPPDAQRLQFIHRKQGQLRAVDMDACRFVPLVADGNSVT
jgi:protein-L-isoaspartate(D-aspartate) O-methyltransferase